MCADCALPSSGVLLTPVDLCIQFLAEGNQMLWGRGAFSSSHEGTVRASHNAEGNPLFSLFLELCSRTNYIESAEKGFKNIGFSHQTNEVGLGICIFKQAPIKQFSHFL